MLQISGVCNLKTSLLERPVKRSFATTGSFFEIGLTNCIKFAIFLLSCYSFPLFFVKRKCLLSRGNCTLFTIRK